MDNLEDLKFNHGDRTWIFTFATAGWQCFSTKFKNQLLQSSYLPRPIDNWHWTWSDCYHFNNEEYTTYTRYLKNIFLSPSFQLLKIVGFWIILLADEKMKQSPARALSNLFIFSQDFIGHNFKLKFLKKITIIFLFQSNVNGAPGPM